MGKNRKLKSFAELNQTFYAQKSISYEIIKGNLRYENDNPIHFLKWATKYNELDGIKIKNMNNFEEVFSFAKPNDKNDNKFKNLKNTEFALAWFKNYKFKEKKDIKYFEISKKEYETAKKLNRLPEVQNLVPYSFILHAEIKLTAPYFSRDDDNFYLIQNPCLKEKVFKIPMIRGSGWKGAIARAGKDLINENFKWFSSYVRIFGTGSNEYRTLIDNIKLVDNIKKDKDLKENLIKYLIKYLIFDLGKKLTGTDIEQINKDPEKYLKNLNINKDAFKNLPYLQVHKGRAIFYPTYFDRLSLEIINPHSRKTRAGTNPIHYEVVPKDSKGTLQIVYIPYDAVLTKDEDVKNQVEADIEFLTKCIEKASEIGIGAKEKLGWGRFEFVKENERELKKITCNRDVDIPKGWENEKS